MNRIGLLKIVRARTGGGEDRVAYFPETTFKMYLETVKSETELLTKESYQKVYGYRLHIDFEITRFPDSFYDKNYAELDIEEQATEFATMLNELININLPNREFTLYPDFTYSDLQLRFILTSESLIYEKSSSVLNIGQKLNLSFCDKFYCNGQTYYPYETHSGFYLPYYLSTEGVES